MKSGKILFTAKDITCNPPHMIGLNIPSVYGGISESFWQACEGKSVIKKSSEKTVEELKEEMSEYESDCTPVRRARHWARSFQYQNQRFDDN